MFNSEGGEALAQAAPLEFVQGQGGCSPKQPGLVEDVPPCGRGLELEDCKVLPTQSSL